MNKNFIIVIIISFIILLPVGLYFFSKKHKSTKQPTKYICVTFKEGETFNINAPTGTHFTKLIFADFGTPSPCPNPGYGNCTSSNKNFPGFPFDVIKNTIDGKDVNGETSFGPFIISTQIGDPCYGIQKNITVKLEYVHD
jgi:hypothetical protein